MHPCALLAATALLLGRGLLAPPDTVRSADDLMIAEAIRHNFHGPATLSLPIWAWLILPRDTTRPHPATEILGSGLASDLIFQLREGPAVGLIRIVIPLIPVDELVRLISIPAPIFPFEAQRQRIGSHVDLQHVVTPEGRADPNTLRVTQAQYREFFVAAATAIMHGKVRAGMVAGLPGADDGAAADFIQHR
jgi:hypothetical protein